MYVGESPLDAASAFCISFLPESDRATCIGTVAGELISRLERNAEFVANTVSNTNPEYFDHRESVGFVDAAVGYMQSQVRRDADSQADSLLLLALNKRMASLEDTLRHAVVEVPIEVMQARRNSIVGSGSNSSSGSGSEPEVAGAWRPDRCLPLYSTFEPAALNVIPKVNASL